jgi:hypothetical protein
MQALARKTDALAFGMSQAHLLALWQDNTMTYTYSRNGFGRRSAFQFGRAASREDRLTRIDALATLLDTAFIVPGTNVRFGFDALLGLVPGIGDAVTTAMSLYLVHEARQLGVPRYLLLRMLGNVAIDGIVGAVPVLGDAFDVMWRANRRNVRLLQDWLHRVGDHQVKRASAARQPSTIRAATELSAFAAGVNVFSAPSFLLHTGNPESSLRSS